MADNPQIVTDGAQIYAATFIEALGKKLIPVTAFSRNFSDEFGSDFGDEVVVPYVEAGTVSAYDATTNNFETAPQDAYKVCTVKLDQHDIIKYAVTPEAVVKFSPIHWQEKARMNAEEMASTLIGKIAAIATGSKVKKTTELPATITISDVVDLAKTANAQGIVPEQATLFLTTADYFDILKLQTWNTTGTLDFANGALSGVRIGFKDIVLLPYAVEKSFIAKPDLVCIGSKAFRAPYALANETVLTEANTGLSFVQTLTLVNGNKNLIHAIDCLHGEKVGNPDAGIVISRAQ